MAYSLDIIICILSIFVLYSINASGEFSRINPFSDLPTPDLGIPWPLPSSISLNEKSLIVDPDHLQISTSSSCRLITEAINRCKQVIAKEGGNKSSASYYWRKGQDVFNTLKLLIDNESDCDRYPYLNMNESYQVIVNEKGTGNLRAPGIWGAIRGLETFSQLVFPDQQGGLRIRVALIEDEPRFAHRGILLDTSRHYLSMNVLKKNLDLMAFAKFNVFHWHIVDDPSFPYVSDRYPRLGKKGAYSMRHVYTTKDIDELVEYARLRGIRVIPEFDTPGHMLSWGRGMPELLTECEEEYGIFDPSNFGNYDFLAKFLQELAQHFPDEYIHFGGDEVNFECWRKNQQVQQMMKKMNISSELKLETYYMKRLIQVADWAKMSQGHNTTGHLVWQEIFDNGIPLDSQSIIQVWKGSYSILWYLELFRITLYGYRAILSSCWYLNDIVYGENWEGYYLCDPHSFLLTRRQKSLIIGGEACMWGEYIDGTNLLPTLWPRASVVAERLWSQRQVNNPQLARPRLEEHRCRLIRRGFPASPVNGPGFCSVEWDQ